MPNWCNNYLEVNGPKKDRDLFQKQAMGKTSEDGNNVESPLVFENFAPTPPELLDGDGWYGWRVDNWGTKWDACDPELQEKDDFLLYIFETAWSPPVEFVNNVSALFPSLTFQLNYDECGMLFAGEYIWKNGSNMKAEHKDFDNQFDFDTYLGMIPQTECNTCGEYFEPDSKEEYEKGLCPDCLEKE